MSKRVQPNISHFSILAVGAVARSFSKSSDSSSATTQLHKPIPPFSDCVRLFLTRSCTLIAVGAAGTLSLESETFFDSSKVRTICRRVPNHPQFAKALPTTMQRVIALRPFSIDSAAPVPMVADEPKPLKDELSRLIVSDLRTHDASFSKPAVATLGKQLFVATCYSETRILVFDVNLQVIRNHSYGLSAPGDLCQCFAPPKPGMSHGLPTLNVVVADAAGGLVRIDLADPTAKIGKLIFSAPNLVAVAAVPSTPTEYVVHQFDFTKGVQSPATMMVVDTASGTILKQLMSSLGTAALITLRASASILAVANQTIVTEFQRIAAGPDSPSCWVQSKLPSKSVDVKAYAAKTGKSDRAQFEVRSLVELPDGSLLVKFGGSQPIVRFLWPIGKTTNVVGGYDMSGLAVGW